MLGKFFNFYNVEIIEKNSYIVYVWIEIIFLGGGEGFDGYLSFLEGGVLGVFLVIL